MEGRKQSATGQESEDFMKYFTKLDLSTAMNLTPEAMDAPCSAAASPAPGKA